MVAVEFITLCSIYIVEVIKLSIKNLDLDIKLPREFDIPLKKQNQTLSFKLIPHTDDAIFQQRHI